MKCLKALLLAPLVLGACEKSNNVAQLHEQASAIGKTYAPIAAELGKRIDSIRARGRNVPGNLPDVPDLVHLINEAGDKISEMKGITAAIDKQADEAAKANKPAELEKLIDESHEKLDLDETIANEDLTRIESWLWQYDQGHAAQPAPPPPPPSEAPEPTNDASGAGSAAPAAAPPADKAAAKADKAKSDKTEKAAQKAATEKADKKAAAPKAGAGSAAK